MGLCSAFVRCALRPSDTEYERYLKRMLVPPMLVIVSSTLVISVFYYPWTLLNDIGFLAVFGCLTLAYVAMCAGFPVQEIVGVTLAGLLVAVIILDWFAVITLSLRVVGLVVPFLDCSLVVGLPHKFNTAMLSTTLVWTTFSFIDQTSLGGRWLQEYGGRNGAIPWQCDCEAPPCGIPVLTAVSFITYFWIVLVLDFHVTRSFAAEMRAQTGIVRASVSLSAEVAMLLARYEVDAAECAVLRDRSALPEDLRAAYLLLLENLRKYRPYLPASCFCEDSESSDAGGEVVREPTELSASIRRVSTGADTADSGRVVRARASEADLTTPPAATLVKQEPRRRQIALVCCNAKHFLQRHETPQSMTAFLYDHYVKFAAVTVDSGGVVDLLSGDHCFASFNGAKRCGCYKQAGLRCAWDTSRRADQEPGMQMTGAVVGGAAICGDFGTNDTRRFMQVGRVSSRLLVFERCAADWPSEGPLLDDAVWHDASHAWELRLRGQVSVRRVGWTEQSRAATIWEATGPRPKGSGGAAEWMYELGRMKPDPWAAYNRVVRSLLDGDEFSLHANLAELRDKAGPRQLAAVAEMEAAARSTVERCDHSTPKGFRSGALHILAV
eukprot:TRINITY_DN25686_c0_g1_i1.p1 TRINITY_DN25686_c0_g1~~TRINITY_DN25686_c0_g1_i1.p1  ORF type:complete len:610 (+),score=139.24 TRINITY_DN25686_c0_g1_i1:63-1892(+)